MHFATSSGTTLLGRAASAALIVAFGLPAGLAKAVDPCGLHWRETGYAPGLHLAFSQQYAENATVRALVPDPTSPLPALVAGGSFTLAFGQPLSAVGRWDGRSWSAFGEGIVGGVNAIASFAPSGRQGEPELVAGGSFLSAGGEPALRVARWNGDAWLPLAGGVDGHVHALCVFDDGNGPSLYAAGTFTHADGAPANRIARWDGFELSAVGSSPGGGMDGVVRALKVFDDGSGARLIAAGDFLAVDGQPAAHVAAWDGETWSPLGAGIPVSVKALEVGDLGSGPRLYAGGQSTEACCLSKGTLASWDGAAWNASEASFDATVFALHFATVDGASALLAGGVFTKVTAASGITYCSRMARFDGTSWSRMGTVYSSVLAITSLPAGSDPTIYIGGAFSHTGAGLCEATARWDGTEWRPVAPHSPGFWANHAVYDATVATVDGEPMVVLAGEFDRVGDVQIGPVASWRSGAFEPLGGGLSGTALAVHASTREPGVIYAAGFFGGAAPGTTIGLMRWDGSAWTSMATLSNYGGSSAYGYAIAEHDDGSGPALYLGGTFSHVDGQLANGLARFDGTAWAPMSPPLGQNAQVRALATFDSGDGERLFVGVSGSLLGYLLMWNGIAWTKITAPPGGNSVPWALAVHDDGSGPKLFTAGEFEHLVRWDGTTAELLGVVGTSRRRLLSHDFGAGPTLLIAGDQGVFTPAISAWNGAEVVPIPGVISEASAPNTDGTAWALASLPDGRVLLGGWFRWMNEVPGYRPMANLAVLDPSATPWIVDQPDDAAVSAGDEATFEVQLFHEPKELDATFQWRRDGVALRDSEHVVGATMPLLTLSSVSTEDTGVYDVVVSNACGESKSKAALLSLTCAGDVDADGAVGGSDLAAMLAAWGPADGSSADLNGDGEVDGADLGLLLAAWGACAG